VLKICCARRVVDLQDYAQLVLLRLDPYPATSNQKTSERMYFLASFGHPSFLENEEEMGLW
jgi:hypothetical protein